MSETVIPFPGVKQDEVTPRKINQIGLDSRVQRTLDLARKAEKILAERKAQRAEKRGGMPKDSPEKKPPTSSGSMMLTPSEQEQLRKNSREAGKLIRKRPKELGRG